MSVEDRDAAKKRLVAHKSSLRLKNPNEAKLVVQPFGHNNGPASPKPGIVQPRFVTSIKTPTRTLMRQASMNHGSRNQLATETAEAPGSATTTVDVKKRSRTQDASRLVRAATISNPSNHAGSTISSTQKSVSKYSVFETTSPAKSTLASTKTKMKTTTTTIETAKEPPETNLAKTSQISSTTTQSERKTARTPSNKPETPVAVRKSASKALIEQRLAHLYDDTSESDVDRTASQFANSDRSAHTHHTYTLTTNHDSAPMENNQPAAVLPPLTEAKSTSSTRIAKEPSRSSSCHTMCKRHYRHTSRSNEAPTGGAEDHDQAASSKTAKPKLDTFRLKQLRGSKSIDAKGSNSNKMARTTTATHGSKSRTLKELEKEANSISDSMVTNNSNPTLEDRCATKIQAAWRGYYVRNVGKQYAETQEIIKYQRIFSYIKNLRKNLNEILDDHKEFCKVNYDICDKLIMALKTFTTTKNEFRAASSDTRGTLKDFQTRFGYLNFKENSPDEEESDEGALKFFSPAARIRSGKQTVSRSNSRHYARNVGEDRVPEPLDDKVKLLEEKCRKLEDKLTSVLTSQKDTCSTIDNMLASKLEDSIIRLQKARKHIEKTMAPQPPKREKLPEPHRPLPEETRSSAPASSPPLTQSSHSQGKSEAKAPASSRPQTCMSGSTDSIRKRQVKREEATEIAPPMTASVEKKTSKIDVEKLSRPEETKWVDKISKELTESKRSEKSERPVENVQLHPPLRVRLQKLNEKSVALKWNPNPKNDQYDLSGYKIYINNELCGVMKPIDFIASINGIHEEGEYRIFVRAYYEEIESANSNEVITRVKKKPKQQQQQQQQQQQSQSQATTNDETVFSNLNATLVKDTSNETVLKEPQSKNNNTEKLHDSFKSSKEKKPDKFVMVDEPALKPPEKQQPETPNFRRSSGVFKSLLSNSKTSFANELPKSMQNYAASFSNPKLPASANVPFENNERADQNNSSYQTHYNRNSMFNRGPVSGEDSHKRHVIYEQSPPTERRSNLGQPDKNLYEVDVGGEAKKELIDELLNGNGSFEDELSADPTNNMKKYFTSHRSKRSCMPNLERSPSQMTIPAYKPPYSTSTEKFDNYNNLKPYIIGPDFKLEKCPTADTDDFQPNFPPAPRNCNVKIGNSFGINSNNNNNNYHSLPRHEFLMQSDSGDQKMFPLRRDDSQKRFFHESVQNSAADLTNSENKQFSAFNSNKNFANSGQPVFINLLNNNLESINSNEKIFSSNYQDGLLFEQSMSPSTANLTKRPTSMSPSRIITSTTIPIPMPPSQPPLPIQQQPANQQPDNQQSTDQQSPGQQSTNTTATNNSNNTHEARSKMKNSSMSNLSSDTANYFEIFQSKSAHQLQYQDLKRLYVQNKKVKRHHSTSTDQSCQTQQQKELKCQVEMKSSICLKNGGKLSSSSHSSISKQTGDNGKFFIESSTYNTLKSTKQTSTSDINKKKLEDSVGPNEALASSAHSSCINKSSDRLNELNPANNLRNPSNSNFKIIESISKPAKHQSSINNYEKSIPSNMSVKRVIPLHPNIASFMFSAKYSTSEPNLSIDPSKMESNQQENEATTNKLEQAIDKPKSSELNHAGQEHAKAIAGEDKKQMNNDKFIYTKLNPNLYVLGDNNLDEGIDYSEIRTNSINTFDDLHNFNSLLNNSINYNNMLNSNKPQYYSSHHSNAHLNGSNNASTSATAAAASSALSNIKYGCSKTVNNPSNNSSCSNLKLNKCDETCHDTTGESSNKIVRNCGGHGTGTCQLYNKTTKHIAHLKANTIRIKIK